MSLMCCLLRTATGGKLLHANKLLLSSGTQLKVPAMLERIERHKLASVKVLGPGWHTSGYAGPGAAAPLHR